MEKMDEENTRPINKLLVLDRAEKLLDETYVTTRKYPKAEKFVLASETRKAAMDFLRLIIRAEKKYYKKTTLQDADIELDEIRHLFRFAYKQRYISPGRYEILSKLTTETGKLLGGWIKQQMKAK